MALVEDFYNDMPTRMADAHLIISRSGASTVCELMVMGRPAILVPLPQALDGDQAANAKYLVEEGGAWLMPQSEMTPDHLCGTLKNSLPTRQLWRVRQSRQRNWGGQKLLRILPIWWKVLPGGVRLIWVTGGQPIRRPREKTNENLTISNRQDTLCRYWRYWHERHRRSHAQSEL